MHFKQVISRIRQEPKIYGVNEDRTKPNMIIFLVSINIYFMRVESSKYCVNHFFRPIIRIIFTNSLCILLLCIIYVRLSP